MFETRGVHRPSRSVALLPTARYRLNMNEAVGKVATGEGGVLNSLMFC